MKKESTIKLTHGEVKDLLNKINKHTPNKELENGSSMSHIYNKLTIAYYELPENLR